MIYFAEKDAQHKWSFMDSFWWGLMVLTTVGYGARAPYTWAGQVWYGIWYMVYGMVWYGMAWSSPLWDTGPYTWAGQVQLFFSH